MTNMLIIFVLIFKKRSISYITLISYITPHQEHLIYTIRDFTFIEKHLCNKLWVWVEFWTDYQSSDVRKCTNIFPDLPYKFQFNRNTFTKE